MTPIEQHLTELERLCEKATKSDSTYEQWLARGEAVRALPKLLRILREIRKQSGPDGDECMPTWNDSFEDCISRRRIDEIVQRIINEKG